MEISGFKIADLTSVEIQSNYKKINKKNIPEENKVSKSEFNKFINQYKSSLYKKDYFYMGDAWTNYYDKFGNKIATCIKELKSYYINPQLYELGHSFHKKIENEYGETVSTITVLNDCKIWEINTTI